MIDCPSPKNYPLIISSVKGEGYRPSAPFMLCLIEGFLSEILQVIYKCAYSFDYRRVSMGEGSHLKKFVNTRKILPIKPHKMIQTKLGRICVRHATCGFKIQSSEAREMA